MDQRRHDMKYIIILGDGMADEPIPSLGGKTPLQAAAKPEMDWLAAHGRNGLLDTIPRGFAPGSEIANLAILGYDLPKVFEGRGSLEAASMGVPIGDNEMAMRCNLITIEDGRIKNHSGGQISSEEAAQLMEYLQQELGGGDVNFFPGVSYRHLLKMKGGNKHIITTPPHDVIGAEFGNYLVKPDMEGSEETAEKLNRLILKSMELLPGHPVNIARAKAGKDMLYMSQLRQIIPKGVTGADSTDMAGRVIREWKLERLLLMKAEAELPASQLDVSEEIEGYRRSLLVYRYESMYLSERLDTSVTDMEIEEYYRENQEFFRTSSMLVRGYFVKMNADSPNLATVRYNLKNLDDSDTEELELLSARVSFSYLNFYDYWVALSEFVPDFGMDIGTLTKSASMSSFLEAEYGGAVSFLKIWERIPAGEIAPLAYCRDAVVERILNLRKKQLLDDLERDLLMESVS